MYYFSILYSFPPFIFQGGHNLVMFHLMKLKMAETESFNQRNAPRLTGGTPATRRRKVGGRSGSPHRGRRARRGVSGAPNRRAVRPARGGGGRTAPATKAFFLRMPGRSAANPMRQYTNAKTVTESFVRVYALVALQCGPAPKRYTGVTRRQLTRYAM